MTKMRRPKLAAVWTRNVDTSRMAGRPRIIQSIRSVMRENCDLIELRLANILENRRASALQEVAIRAILSIASGRLPPAQCLLFAGRANHAMLAAQLAKDSPDILYCDGIRTYYFLQYLDTLSKQMRIVVDLDDLMSRRMASLIAAESILSLGYLQDKAPPFLSRLVSSKTLSKIIARYEQHALAKAENQLCELADSVTLVSNVESSLLRERLAKHDVHAQVRAIPPPVDIQREPQSYERFSHFFFIGTDSLPQNRLTIQKITEFWSVLKPSADIHIFGQMTSEWPSVQGVVFRGYAASLNDVYREGAVLFAPGTVEGGLKTKAVEAFAHGCAVIGNGITFEGIPLSGYPLAAGTEEELAAIIKAPTHYLRAFREAARTGQAQVLAYFSRSKFEQAWKAVLQCN